MENIEMAMNFVSLVDYMVSLNLKDRLFQCANFSITLQIFAFYLERPEI